MVDESGVLIGGFGHGRTVCMLFCQYFLILYPLPCLEVPHISFIFVFCVSIYKLSLYNLLGVIDV